MRVFEPYSVTVLTTSTCTAACRHCSMNSSPERRERLSGEQLQHLLTGLFDEVPDLKVVVFAGGEPTLLGDDLLDAIRRCKARGAITRVITNAYWATSPEAARAKLLELRDAGLHEVNISTDDYHLPWISLQRVRYAYEAALELDFMSVVLANCHGPESWLTPERINGEFGGGGMMTRFDDEGHSRKLEFKKGGTLVLLSNSNVQRLGRGLDHIEDTQLPPAGMFDMTVDGVGGCPWAVRSAAISPKGHLLSCCGFELEDNPILDYGDGAEHSMGTLLDRADGDLITNMIAMIGPPRIKEILEAVCPDEVHFPRTYRSYCEVCTDLVTDERNRQALYKYQSQFVDLVMKVRDSISQEFRLGDKVRIPPGFNVKVEDRGAAEVDAGGKAAG